MTIVQRNAFFLNAPCEDVAGNALPVLDQLAETLRQSCQLVVCQENTFRVMLQSIPSTAFYVNMPIGMIYQVREDEDGASDQSCQAGQQPNPNLPDVTDVYAPVFHGPKQVALLVSSCVRRHNAPSLEECRTQVTAAAHRLSASLVTHALVA